MWFKARTIIEEDDVSVEVDRLKDMHSRFDKAYEALKWLLARSCDVVECLPCELNEVEYRLYKQAGDVFAGTPDIVVLYRYDASKVNILGIRAEKPGIDDEQPIYGVS